jgi:hypothetical protein
MNMQDIKEASKKAEEQTKGMKRKVNAKVMHMIEGCVFFFFVSLPRINLVLQGREEGQGAARTHRHGSERQAKD